MRMIVLHPGAFTTVQDLGRRGHRAVGVSPGGAVDAVALRLANLAVGNDESAAALECTLVGPRVKFSADAVIAVGGARVDGIDSLRPIRVSRGQVVSLERRTFLSTVATSFIFDQQAVPQKSVFEFSDLVTDFTKSDLTVRNLSSGEPATFLEQNNMALANPSGNTWELTFPGYLYGAVPDAYYETILEKESVAGLTNDGIVEFWFYSADFNRDRSVNIGDFSILAANFNTPQSFTGGDTTYDGTADISDFSIMGAKFNMHIDPPPTEPNTLQLIGTTNPATSNPRITLNWSAVADPNRLGFRIWQSSDGVNFGDVYATVGATTYTFNDDDVQEGGHYWYRVRAYSAAGNSATTPKMDMLTPLKAPTGLTITQIDSGHFDFTCIDNSNVETEFRLYRYSDNPANALLVNTAGTSSSTGGTVHLTDTLPVGPAPQYSYYVLAWNNTSSAPSNIVGTRPSVPQTPTVTFSPTPLSLTLDWADNPEAGVTYNLYRSTSADFDPTFTIQRATGLTLSNYSDTTVSAATRYYYAVTAVQNFVESLPSDPGTQVTGTHAQPTNLQASASDETSIALGWTDMSSDETGYSVDIYQGATLIRTDTLPADSEGASVDSLIDGTTYNFEVRATFAGRGEPEAGPTASAATLGENQATSLVIAINGHFQSANTIDDPITSDKDERTGIKRIVEDLRNYNIPGGGEYRVLEAAEDVTRRKSGLWVDWDGNGTLLQKANALLNSPTSTIRDVAIIGYSHGGGVIDDLINRLYQNRPLQAQWTVKFVGTIDAIARHFVDYFVPAFAQTSAMPHSPAYHYNYYNIAPWNPVPYIFGEWNPVKGEQIAGANVQTGLQLVHQEIQYDSGVRSTMFNQIKNRIHL